MHDQTAQWKVISTNTIDGFCNSQDSICRSSHGRHNVLPGLKPLKSLKTGRISVTKSASHEASADSCNSRLGSGCCTRWRGCRNWWSRWNWWNWRGRHGEDPEWLPPGRPKGWHRDCWCIAFARRNPTWNAGFQFKKSKESNKITMFDTACNELKVSERYWKIAERWVVL